MDNKIKSMLESFDKNQIREINQFLNSDKGKHLKNSMSERDKEEILKKLEGLDPQDVRKAMSKFSANDLLKIMGKL